MEPVKVLGEAGAEAFGVGTSVSREITEASEASINV